MAKVLKSFYCPYEQKTYKRDSNYPETNKDVLKKLANYKVIDYTVPKPKRTKKVEQNA